MIPKFLDHAVWNSAYAYLAYCATLASLVFVTYMFLRILNQEKSLNSMSVEDRLAALKLLLPESSVRLSSRDWLRARKFRLIFLGFLTVILAFSPLLYLANSDSPEQVLARFFNLRNPQELCAASFPMKQGSGDSRRDEISDQTPVAQNGDSEEQNRDSEEQNGDSEEQNGYSEERVATDTKKIGDRFEGQDGPKVDQEGKNKPDANDLKADGKGLQESQGDPADQSDEIYHLRSAIDGVVEQVFVAVGDHVDKGAPILRLVNPWVLGDLESQKISLERAEHELSNFIQNRSIRQKLLDMDVESKLDLSEQVNKRHERLKAFPQIVPRYFIEEIEYSRESAESELVLARAQREHGLQKLQEDGEMLSLARDQAAVNYKRAQLVAELLVIRTPVKGRLVYVVKAGDSASFAGSRPVAKILFSKDSVVKESARQQ